MRLHDYLAINGIRPADAARDLRLSRGDFHDLLGTLRDAAYPHRRRASPELARRIVEWSRGLVSLEEALFPPEPKRATPAPREAACATE